MSAAGEASGNGEGRPAAARPRASHRLLPRRAGVSPSAQRAHSLKVSILRVLLPATAVLIVGVIVVWAQWSEIEAGFRIGFARINPEEAKTLRMVNPRFAGVNKRSRPFMLTADEARRTSPGADQILLKNPKGDITTESGAWVALMAARGKYAQKTQILDLAGGIDLFHDKGLHFTSSTAHIDLKAGTAEGHDRVTGSGPSIDITGEGFKLLDGGKTVIFTGKSKAILYPRDRRKRNAPPKRLAP